MTNDAAEKLDIQNRITEIRKVRLSDILNNPNNPKMHPDDQRRAMQGVLSELGWAGVPVVYRSERAGGELVYIDGHLRRDIAPDLEAEVAITDLSDEEADYLLVMYDPIARMARDDAKQLEKLLDGITTSDQAVEKLLNEIAKDNNITFGDEPVDDPGADIDKAEELREKWGVESGQLWQLGDHRVICGDCTDASVVERLMDGERAGAVITDPPYGQNQPGVPGDEPEKHAELMIDCVKVLPIVDAIIISFQSPRTFVDWLDAIRENGHVFNRMLWLYKEAQMSKPWRGWILKSESILISTLGKPSWIEVKPYSHDCYKLSEVSNEIDESMGWHGSIKPLSVVQDLTSRTGGLVYDPFLGSGTTLIAAENLNRKCYGIEIAPKYVAVILERWSIATGRTPILIDSNQCNCTNDCTCGDAADPLNVKKLDIEQKVAHGSKN